MKKINTILILLFPFLLNAQTSGTSQIVSGSIEMPVLQSLKIEVIDNAPLSFSDRKEIENGIIKPGYYRLTVISNVPWVLDVMSNTPFLGAVSSSSSTKAPVSIVEIRGNKGGFIPLSNKVQTIYVSEGNAIKSIIELDLRVKPSVLTEGGKYTSGISFMLSAQ